MATLLLQDGTIVKGKSFGALGGYEGEVVFNTLSSGYQEVITDPAYAKQIVVMAYPEIGNCGINDFDFESQKAHLVGLIVKNYSKQESHYRSKQTLSKYLQENNVIAIEGVDTRTIVKKITEFGTMAGFISSNDLDMDFIRNKLQEIQMFKIKESVLIDVTPNDTYVCNQEGKLNIAFIDYGSKKSVLNELIKRNCKLTVFPAHISAKEILDNNFDAVFLSSGPGNPNNYTYQVAQIKQMMNKIPLFGISLGCELLALASGASVTKLRHGHRGGSYPVINLENNKVIMSAQNHGYAIDSENMTKFMRPTYKNLNDNSIEGFEISSLKVYAVQFNPEGVSGSEDGLFIFDEWINIAQKNIKRVNEVENER